MKRIVLVLCLVASALAQSGVPILGSTFKGSGGGATPVVTTLSSTCNTGGASTGFTCSFTASTAGATIVVYVNYDDAGGFFPTVSDGTNTFTRFASTCSTASPAAFDGLSCQYSFTESGSISSVNISWPSGFSAGYAKVIQITNNVNGQDVGAFAVSGGGTSFSSGATGSTASANEVAIGCARQPTAVTLTASSYTAFAQESANSITYLCAYKVGVGATETYDGSSNTAGFIRAGVGTYKD